MKTKLLFNLIILCFGIVANAQSIGTKNELILKLNSYTCGEETCTLEMKDLKTNKTYAIFDLIDDKSKDNGIFKEIQKLYYQSGSSDAKLKSKNYKVVLEYRGTDELIYVSPEEPPKKTGKKNYKWMVNSISRI